MKYGITVLPLLLSVGVFLVSTTGFFLTTGKKEAFYGVCSIAGAAAAVVQAAFLLT